LTVGEQTVLSKPKSYISHINFSSFKSQIKLQHILIAIGILFILLVSQTIIPTSIAADNPSIDRTYWLNLASRAWEFYAPRQSLDTQTGLYAASLDWPYFTEWDLGTQIQALLEAKALGLLPDTGQWGFINRTDKLIDWLKTRSLTDNNVPYALYDSRNGDPAKTDATFSIDEGNLYLALNELSTVRPELSQDINYIIKVRNNNAEIVPDPKTWLNSTDLYCYFIASAFKTLQFEGWADVPSSILGTIVSQQNVTTYGIKLPQAHICMEPLVESIFELNPKDVRFIWLANQVYQAHEARYNATGHYTAFSEGNTALSDPGYVYEYVVDTDGATWKVDPYTTPIAYIKVAVSFHAIFGTVYTKNLMDYINSKLPAITGAFQEGVDESGRYVYSRIDRTNKQIMSAARYVLEDLSNPNPTPSPYQENPQETTSPSQSTPASPSQSPDPISLPSITPTLSYSASSTPKSQNSDGLWNELLIIGIGIFTVLIATVAVVRLKKKKKIKLV
jgi:hypothetical protein